MTQFQTCKAEVLKLTPIQRAQFSKWLENRILEEQSAPELMRRIGEDAIRTINEIIGEPLLFTSRLKRHVFARTVVAVYLVDQGFSLTQAGKVIYKNHSTVSMLLQNAKDYEAYPHAFWEYAQMKKEFDELIYSREL